MAQFKTIDDLDVGGKTVLVRGDLNVPTKDGRVTDTTRIDRLAPTLTELAGKGAKVVILSHFGRPKGGPDEANSLKQVVTELERALDAPVIFGEDCIGPRAKMAITKAKAGGYVLLENLRFHKQEEKNDVDFAKALAELGDIYINDAFSCAHRAHASTEALARLLPCAAGRLMEAELKALALALEQPERPVAAVVGGAKISTKLELLGNLVSKVDVLILGGGMANTFLFAQGVAVGKSLCEKDMAEQARAIMARAAETGCRIILPVDGVVAREFKAWAAHQVVPVEALPEDGMVLDLGPASIARITESLGAVKTVVWNGPLGAFESEPFDAGTNQVALAVAGLTETHVVRSVAGGGDTVAALVHAGAEKGFTYISTAGGAFLEWLEGKDLPGVVAIKSRA